MTTRHVKQDLLLALAVLLALLIGAACAAYTSDVANRCACQPVAIRAVDGDTLLVTIGQATGLRVRLTAIDAPESRQPHGREATAALEALVASQRLRLDVSGTDRYGRLLARVAVVGGVDDVGLWMVEQGHAWWYRQYAHDRADMAAAEDAARRAGLGLWAQDYPTPPWVWRQKHKRGGK